MDKTKCITFDKAAQDALPDHIKAKMKADREKAREKFDNAIRSENCPFGYCPHTFMYCLSEECPSIIK